VREGESSGGGKRVGIVFGLINGGDLKEFPL
jgi:hypothetical protein